MPVTGNRLAILRRLVVALVIAVCPSLSQAQMYKCVDKQGITHYTDSPRPGCQGREIEIRPQPPVSGGLKPRKEDFAREEADFRRRQEAREAAETRERRQLAEHCQLLRSRHSGLKGQRRRLVIDDELERRIQRVEWELRACP